MYIKFYVYVNNTQYSAQAKQSVICSPHYNGGYILEKLPEGAEISKDVTIDCWGFPSYGYSFYVKDS